MYDENNIFNLKVKFDIIHILKIITTVITLSGCQYRSGAPSSASIRQPKLLVEDRLCTSCKAIAGELHFVMTCTAQNGFTRPRQLMLQKYFDECPGFTFLTYLNFYSVLPATYTNQIKSNFI